PFVQLVRPGCCHEYWGSRNHRRGTGARQSEAVSGAELRDCAARDLPKPKLTTGFHIFEVLEAGDREAQGSEETMRNSLILGLLALLMAAVPVYAQSDPFVGQI